MTMVRTGIFHTLNQFLEDTENVRVDDNVKLKIINSLQPLAVSLSSTSPM